MIDLATRIALVSAAIWFTTAAAGNAQPKPGALLGEEKRVRDELDAAARLAADKRWDDAVRRYQQIITESGDLFVSVPGDAARALPARWLVHQQIAALPPEGRRIFRAGSEESARKWLQLGSANRDIRMLEQVVAEAFCTQVAEQALHLLGDLALERGEFDLAEHYWRMLARYPSETDNKNGKRDGYELIHPDPEGDGALARAKLILGLLFRGEKERARNELDSFRKLHPSAPGHIAGRTGKLADILAGLIDAKEKWTPAAHQAAGGKWTTFGGDAARNLRIPAEDTPYWPDAPTWRVPLPGDPGTKPFKDADPPLGTGAAARGLAFHPVVVPGYVLVADAARVFAYHLVTGKLAAEFDYRKIAKVPESADLRVPSRTDARYTLTVVGDRIYARFGAQPVKPAQDSTKPEEIDSAIVCLSLQRSDKGVEFHFRWQIRARNLDGEPPAMFEGTPVVRDGKLYAARTQFDGRQAISSISCFDADSPDGREDPPPPRWKQDVWSVEQTADPVRHRHDLVTLAGPNVIYCTHSGAIVALDAATGKRAWAYRYKIATNRPPDGVQPPDLNPCVSANGRLFAAPADAQRILCLNARTGESIWQRDGLHVVQMLGVSRGALIVTLGGYPHGIRAFNSAGGVIWTRPDDGDRAAFGRGFLTDNWILWPTRNGLRVLRQDDGEPLDAGSSNEPLGNLAFGEGCLVAATPTELWGFIPDRLRFSRLHDEAERRPESAEARYRLALAEADAGQLAEALAGFRKVEELDQGDWLQGRPLKEVARLRRHEILLLQAEKAWKLDKRDVALASLREASSEPFDLKDRVRSWALRNYAGDKSFPDLFEDPRLHSLWLTQSNGVPIRASDFLHSLLDEKGRREFEQRAAALSVSKPDEAISLFPKANAVQAKLKERLRKAESESNLWEMASLYRLHLEEGRFGLAKVYDQTGYKTESQTLKYRMAPTKFAAPDPPIVARSIDVRLGEKPVRIDELTRFRDWPLGPLRDSGDEPPAVSEEGCAFFFDTRQVVCRSLTSGKVIWAQPIEHEALWCAFHAEGVIVAGPNGASRLRRSDGKPAWQFTTPSPVPLPLKFPEPGFRSAALPANAPRFSAFSLAGSRLYFRWGTERLLALDAESGEPLWSFRAANDATNLNKHYLATVDQVLVQTSRGECLCVSCGNGRVLFRKPAPAVWSGPPVAIDWRTALFPSERDQIKAIELETGRELWTYAPEGWHSLSGAALQVRRDGAQLLLVVERNYGFELHRLNIKDGKPLMRPALIGRERIDLAASALHADAYVFLTDRTAIAVDRDSDKQLWEFQLPRRGREHWRAPATRSAILLHPEAALPQVDLDWLSHRAGKEVVGLPSLSQFQNAANMMYHGYLRRTFPLLALDPKTGKTIRELSFPATGPRAMLLLGDGRAAVATEGRLDLFSSN